MIQTTLVSIFWIAGIASFTYAMLFGFVVPRLAFRAINPLTHLVFILTTYTWTWTVLAAILLTANSYFLQGNNWVTALVIALWLFTCFTNVRNRLVYGPPPLDEEMLREKLVKRRLMTPEDARKAAQRIVEADRKHSLKEFLKRSLVRQLWMNPEDAEKIAHQIVEDIPEDPMEATQYILERFPKNPKEALQRLIEIEDRKYPSDRLRDGDNDHENTPIQRNG